jgi:hypothetical protein
MGVVSHEAAQPRPSQSLRACHPPALWGWGSNVLRAKAPELPADERKACPPSFRLSFILLCGCRGIGPGLMIVVVVDQIQHDLIATSPPAFSAPKRPLYQYGEVGFR